MNKVVFNRFIRVRKEKCHAKVVTMYQSATRFVPDGWLYVKRKPARKAAEVTDDGN
jgi:hypothetical protein